MTIQPAGTPLPDNITEPMTLEALRYVFDLTDWRLQVASLDPITVTVEHDEAFAICLSGAASWRSRDQSRAWVASRILEVAATFDKTYIRRLSLQLPHTTDDSDTKLFLDHLCWRIQTTIRKDMRNHYDTSIRQWEQDALDFIHGDHEGGEKVAFYNYVGLDQVVSVDDLRKAIKAVFTRQHWYLDGHGRGLKLVPDHLFRTIQTRRTSHDDTARARSLVARGIQVLVDDNVRRMKHGQPVAEVSRNWLRDVIEQRFIRDGPWGLIDLVMTSDRERYCLLEPDLDNAAASALIERQRVRLFEPWSP